MAAPSPPTPSAYPRPPGLPFPNTWARFDGKQPLAEGGAVPEFWIQDVSDDLLDSVLDVLSSDVVRESPVAIASGLLEDVVSLQESRDNWRRNLQERMSLVALSAGPDGMPVIAGCNVLVVVNDGSSPPTGRGRARRAIDGALAAQERQVGVLKLFGVDRALYATGLYVRRAFRGQGVALELLRARDPLCRAVGLRLTYTVFSSPAAQAVARKAGFRTLHEQKFSEYRDEEGNAPLARSVYPSYMLMAKEISPQE